MEPNATVTDGEMDGQSVHLTEASFNAFAASMQTNIFIAMFILVVFSFLRFRFSHVYAPVGRIESQEIIIWRIHRRGFLGGY